MGTCDSSLKFGHEYMYASKTVETSMIVSDLACQKGQI